MDKYIYYVYPLAGERFLVYSDTEMESGGGVAYIGDSVLIVKNIVAIELVKSPKEKDDTSTT